MTLLLAVRDKEQVKELEEGEEKQSERQNERIRKIKREKGGGESEIERKVRGGWRKKDR